MMTPMDTTKIAQRISSIEIELARLPHGRTIEPTLGL